MSQLLPTDPLGSIPHPLPRIAALNQYGSFALELEPPYEAAMRRTVEQCEATGAPVIAGGRQRRAPDFLTCCVDELNFSAAGGFVIASAARHRRRMSGGTR